MKQELAKMEGTSSGRDNAGNVGKADGMENLRLLRDVKYFETIFELLAKQYEIARIDEARDASLIQVLDKAVEPERKSKPMRTLIVITVAFLAGIFAVIWSFIKEVFEKTNSQPAQAERLRQVRRYLSWR
jgi:tyrosine-protein kinase Etk/Wzc